MKKIFFPITLGLALFSIIQVNGQNLLEGASWISGGNIIPQSDSLFYLDHPAPLLKTEFKLGKPVLKAEMWITAAGYYETWLNGKRVGDHQLDPAWTNFSKRVYVSSFDVTELVDKGNNSWGIILGNGFYNPLPLKMWGGRNIRNDLPTGLPVAIAMLTVTFTDGSTVSYNTSDKWLSHPGPITRNNVYLGEWYDARKEVKNWNVAGSGSKGWEKAVVSQGPGGKLEPSDFQPIRITRWLEPASIKMDGKNHQIVDFGQNFAGFIKIRIRAQSGDTVRFRYGELIYPDGTLNPMTTVCGQIKRKGVGGPGSPAVAEQVDVYVARGQGDEVFQPRFTFHGFRYVEISGLRQPVSTQDIKAARISSDVEEAVRIVSSSEYLNKLNGITQWTFLSNLQSVQSDCPAREKFGYGGDINATAEAFIYNFNMHDIYRKMIFDWVDAMKPDRFVDTAPSVGIEYCGISWESAFIFLQDAMLVHYGDQELIRKLYQIDQDWMEKVARIHPDLVVTDGLSDHESLAKVPVQLTGTCHYFQVARIMAKFAAVVGDVDGISRYAGLAERIRQRILDLFWDTPSIEVPNQQTFLATLLASEVLDAAGQDVAVARLLEVLNAADYHVSTGIFGTKYLLESLSSHGRTDIAWKVVNQSGFPGWKYMIDNGATTLWETWKESDNTYSQNHPMFGSVSEWYIKWLGGIQPDPENPGSTRAILKPRPVEGLDSLSVEKFYPGGTLKSAWKRQGTSLFYEFTVPEGLTASWVPGVDRNSIKMIKSPAGWVPEKNRTVQGCSLSMPGTYVFEIQDFRR